jgi:hypothetical protein
MLWDLIQEVEHWQFRKKLDEASTRQNLQSDRMSMANDRLDELAEQLRETRALLHKVLVRLEERFGEDLDGSGWVGDEPSSPP